MAKPRLLRITTVPISLHLLLRGQLGFMQQNGFEVLAVSANGSEISELAKLDIPHKIVPFTRKITPVKDFFCLVQLIVIILKFRPALIHTHTPKAGLLGMVAAWICSVPIRMHTIAGLPLTEAKGLKKWILKITERVTYSCSTSLYPNSNGLLDYIKREFNIHPDSYRGSKFKVIGDGSTNGINMHHYEKSNVLQVLGDQIRYQYEIGREDYVYCFVGRVVRDKGIIELVKSFVSIANLDKKVWLLLVGHFEEELDPLTEEIRVEILDHPKIIHVDFQKDVRPFILASNAFVLPSYREGFPNVLLQAGSLEKPCIASDINGCNEIIEAGNTGLLVPAKDIDALHTAMTYLLKNSDQGKQMGALARTRIAGHFEQSYIWNEILKEYQKQLSNCI